MVEFDRQPVLASDLLALRPLRESDFGDLYSIAADPQLWEQHPSKDRSDESVFRAWFNDALSSAGALVVRDAVSLETIGTSRFAYRPDGVLEVGWTFLARSRWGGGWNKELKRLMLRHAFKAVPEVVFTVHSGNLRSQRAVERLGAVRVGEEPDSYGRGTNLVFLLRPESGNRPWTPPAGAPIPSAH